jgi:hypothetical protein
MHRLVLALATLVTAASTTPARADTLPLIVGVPLEYTPGTPFTFELRAPGLVDFSAYSIELVFETEVDSTGLLTVSADRGSTPDYSFPIGSFQATNSISPNGLTQTLLITDSGPNVNTTANVNDLLALVTVSPAAGFSGSITLSVNPDNLFFAINSEGGPDIDPPDNVTIIQALPPVDGVPTPAAWVSMTIGVVILGLRRRA